MLVNQGYHTTLRYISEHPDTLPSTINILASSHKQIHNIYAAKSPNISVEYLEKLSYHGDQWVRRNVIMNQKCPDDILNRLSHDKNDNVRVLASSTLNKRICAHT
jgi:hypothetical protein